MAPCLINSLAFVAAMLVFQATPGRQSADVAAIKEVPLKLRSLTKAGDVAGAIDLFTDDVVYLRPGDEADVGKAAVRRHWQESVDAMVVDIDWRADEVEVSGSLAFIRGDLTFRGSPRTGGEPIVNEQRFIWILRKGDDGSWRIARYMRHSPPSN